jgi:hypothetical protein
LKTEKLTINVQSKLVLGRANLDGDAHRDAAIFNVELSFRWL